MSGVSQTVIAALGGATQQYVSKSGDSRAWLDCRIRQALFPDTDGDPGEEISRDRKALAAGRLRALAVSVVERVKALPVPKTGGRPAKRDPRALAEFLEMSYVEGDDLAQVFIRYLKHQFSKLLTVVERGRWWGDFWRVLDQEWLPLWVRAIPVYVERDILEKIGLNFSG